MYWAEQRHLCAEKLGGQELPAACQVKGMSSSAQQAIIYSDLVSLIPLSSFPLSFIALS